MVTCTGVVMPYVNGYLGYRAGFQLMAYVNI